MHIICPLAGVGSQLQPFVISKPKALIRIAGMRIIDHAVSLLKQNFPHGTSLTFIVGYKKEIIQPYLEKKFGDYFHLYFKIQSPIGLRGEVPYFSGIGDAIALAAPEARGEDIFVFFSDHLPTDPFHKMHEILQEDSVDGVVNVRKVSNPENNGVCVTDENGLITHITKNPVTFVSDIALTWGYMFSKSISSKLFDFLIQQSKETLTSNKTHGFFSVMQKLIDEGANVKTHLMKSPILDFGRIEDFLAGNKYLITHPESNMLLKDTMGGANIHESVETINSIIIPPVFIGENAKIHNSVIGPNVSVGNDVEMNKCIISESVIGDNCTFKNIISDHSLIGDYVTIQDIIKSQLSIGDSSTLSVFKSIF